MLRSRARQAWLHRWGSLLPCSSVLAFAMSLLGCGWHHPSTADVVCGRPVLAFPWREVARCFCLGLIFRSFFHLFRAKSSGRHAQKKKMDVFRKKQTKKLTHLDKNFFFARRGSMCSSERPSFSIIPRLQASVCESSRPAGQLKLVRYD